MATKSKSKERENVVIEEVPLNLVDSSPYNTRRTFDEESLNDLAKSIEKKGFLELITARHKDGRYEVIYGNRRLAAARKLKLAHVALQIKECSDEEAFFLNLVENIDRENMDPIDISNAIVQLNTPKKDPETGEVTDGVSYAEIGRRLGGKRRSWVLDLARLTERASPEVLEKVAAAGASGKVPEGKIDYRSALELTRKIPDREKQIELVETLTASHIKGIQARKIINVVSRHPDLEISEAIGEIKQSAAKLTIDPLDMERIVNHKARGVTLQFLDPKVKESWPVDLYSKVETAQVDKIIRKKFAHLNEVDAEVNGFEDVDELRLELERKYGKLNDEDVIYTVHLIEGSATAAEKKEGVKA